MTSNETEPDQEEGEASTGPSVKELGRFVVGAPKRRRGIAIAAFAIAALAGIGVATAKPPGYVAEVRILAQKNSSTVQAIATKATRDEAPTKSAPDIILQRDNLLAIVKELDLVGRWDSERPPALRLKDHLMASISGPLKEDDQLRAIVGLMEKKLMVNADDNTVNITVEWSNAKTSFDIASLAQKRFFDTRRDAEIGMITDAISILETYVANEREKMDEAVQELQVLEEQKRRGPAPDADPKPASSSDAAAPVRRKIAVRAAPPPAVPPDPELTKELETKKRRIAELEDEHTRRLNELNTQLADLRTTLAPAHPSVLALEMKIESAKDPSPELVQLKIEAKNLEQRLLSAEQAGAGAQGALTLVPEPTSAAHPDAGSPLVVMTERADDDAATVVAKTKLTNATLKYDELTSRIRAARIELDAAQAAFKYKYTVVKPAEIPRDAKKPSPALIGIAGLIAAFLLYFLVPAIADLISGRIIASWQVRKLGIPLLGEVNPPGA